MLQAEGYESELGERTRFLRERLDDGIYYRVTTELDEALVSLETTYRDLYLGRHSERATAFAAAMDSVKAPPDWALAPEEM